MTKHKTGTHEEWLTERLELLKAEKELTRRRAATPLLRQKNSGHAGATDLTKVRSTQAHSGLECPE
jgi:hypothetical protein